MKNFLLFLVVIAFITLFSNKVNHASSPTPIPRHTVNPTQSPPHSNIPYEAMFTGEYVCLPHKATGGVQTLECALGLKLDDGSYVALDLGEKLPQMNFGTGSKLQVKGTFVPIEQINTDAWQKYPIKGIIHAKEVVKI